MGSFCYANEDGNGHITTYIRQGKPYYFLDMMMCREDPAPYAGKENGDVQALLAGEWAGFLYRCENPVDFCLFNREMFAAKKRAVPFGFYLREAPYVTATGCRQTETGIAFLIPRCDKPTVIYKEDTLSPKNRDISIVEYPTVLPNRNRTTSGV